MWRAHPSDTSETNHVLVDDIIMWSLQAKQSDKLVTSFFSAQRSPDSENDMVELPEKKKQNLPENMDKSHYLGIWTIK